MALRIKRNPIRILGDGWEIYAGTFCGERWWRLSSWKAYSKPLITTLRPYYSGFRIGPIGFFKEG